MSICTNNIGHVTAKRKCKVKRTSTVHLSIYDKYLNIWYIAVSEVLLLRIELNPVIKITNSRLEPKNIQLRTYITLRFIFTRLVRDNGVPNAVVLAYLFHLLHNFNFIIYSFSIRMFGEFLDSTNLLLYYN